MPDRLWEEHLKAGFPDASRGREVSGIDLVMLDADAAGCLQTFFAKGTALSIGHAAMLGRCYHDLAIVRGQLHGEEHRYFQRLERVAGEVLAQLSAVGFEA
jgi:hypothetical protein